MAYALLAPGLEDFGLNILEANREQTLVVCHPDSGASELLDDSQCIKIDQNNELESLKKIIHTLAYQNKITVCPQKKSMSDFASEFDNLVRTYGKKYHFYRQS